MDELVVCDKGNSIKAKAMYGSKARRGIYSVAPIDRQISSHFLGSRAILCVVVALEDKYHNHKFLPHFLSLSFYR